MSIRQDHSFIFALYDRCALTFRTLERPMNTTEAKLGDGTTVCSNADGKLVYAEYQSGMKVRRNANSVVVASDDGSYWFGDSSGHWFRVD